MVASPDPLVLRFAGSKDGPAILGLFHEAFGRSLGSEACWWWGATRGVVVGCARIVPARTGMCTSLRTIGRADVAVLPGDLELAALAVDRGHRRCGIGAALVAEVLIHLRQNGLRRVFAHGIEGSGSPELLVRAGFEALGRLPNHCPDGRAAILLARLPPEGAGLPALHRPPWPFVSGFGAQPEEEDSDVAYEPVPA